RVGADEAIARAIHAIGLEGGVGHQVRARLYPGDVGAAVLRGGKAPPSVVAGDIEHAFVPQQPGVLADDALVAGIQAPRRRTGLAGRIEAVIAIEEANAHAAYPSATVGPIASAQSAGCRRSRSGWRASSPRGVPAALRGGVPRRRGPMRRVPRGRRSWVPLAR